MKIPKDSNIMGGRFELAIKDPETNEERYEARFVIQGHRDRDKDVLTDESSRNISNQ